jgi:hypothetical protein
MCREFSRDPSFDVRARGDFRDMAERWEELARTFEEAIRVSGFIEWAAQRVEPPEAFRQGPSRAFGR